MRVVMKGFLLVILMGLGTLAKAQTESEKMSIDQRIVRANERKMRKKKDVTVKDKVKAVKKQDKKSRRKKQPKPAPRRKK